MTLLHPIALAALLPLAALAVWLLTRRSLATRVPFVELWRDVAAASPRVGRRSLPPVSILLILVSAFLAVVAAADLRLSARAGGRAAVTVLIDGTPAIRRSPNLAAAVARVQSELRGIDRVALRFSSAPSAREIDVAQLNEALGLPDGDADLDSSIGRALRETDDTVIVITDRAPAVRSNRLAVIGLPRDGPQIEHAAASNDQLMVTLSGIHSDTKVTASSGTAHAEQSITPISGERQTLFLDLPAKADAIRISLASGDSATRDVGSLVRRGAVSTPRRVGNLSPALTTHDRGVRRNQADERKQ